LRLYCDGDMQHDQACAAHRSWRPREAIEQARTAHPAVQSTAARHALVRTLICSVDRWSSVAANMVERKVGDPVDNGMSARGDCLMER
jgi:hypothetical protein